MSKNYVPTIGDYVMLDVDALPESTKGTARNQLIHIMEVTDGERVWKVMATGMYRPTGETIYFLDGAKYPYKAEELILVGKAETA